MGEPSMSAVHVDGSGTRPARRLKNLRYKRIDLVDRGASHDVASGEGAHVLLFKRDEPAAPAVAKSDSLVDRIFRSVVSKITASLNMVAKGAPLTFEDAQMLRGADDVYEDLYDDLGALWSAISSALYSDVSDKAAAIKTAVQAYCDDLMADLDEWLTTGGDDDASVAKRAAVKKVGRKISAERLQRLQAMHKTLGSFIDEHATPAAPADTSKGDTTMTDVEKKAADEAEAAIQKRIDDALRAAATKETVEKADLLKRVETAEAAVAIEKAERLKATHIAKAASFKGLPVKADDDYKVFQEIDEKLSPEVAKRVTELLQAADAAIVSGDLFKAVGSAREGSGGSAYAEVETLADGLVAKSTSGLTKAQAIDRVIRDNPELYKRHLAEMGR